MKTSITIVFCMFFVIVLLAVSCGSPQTEEAVVAPEGIPNPFVGTWVMNVDKSEFYPPESALKSDVVVIEAQENGLKFTFDRIDAEGNAVHMEEAPKFDGNKYPVIGEGITEMVTLKRLGDNSFEEGVFQDGVEIQTVQVVFSDDGKSSTVTAKTKDENGQELTSITYYDKQ
jgi:hypothetical protein